MGVLFFMWQLERRGVEIRGGREASLMRSLTISHMVHSDVSTIAPDVDLAFVRCEIRKTKLGQVFVVDEAGRLQGSISYLELADGLDLQDENGEALTAMDITRTKAVQLDEGANIEQALQAHGASGEVYIAVVNNTDDCILKGVLHEHDVALAYKKAMEQATRRGARGDLTLFINRVPAAVS